MVKTIKYRKNKQVEVKGMRRIRKKIKRSFAMILTVCMVLTSFQGIAFADPDLDSSAKERDVLFELDGTALKTEAEEAIRSGAFYNAQVGFQELLETSDEEDPIKFVDSDAYADIFDQSTGSIYQLQDIPYAREASASDAMYEDAELQIFVKLNGQAAKAATQSNARKASDSNITEESDSDMEKASDSDLRKPSANDTIVDTENYEMNGDEKLIFLFINRSNDDLTFQLDIDGRKSALVQVESKNVLLATDQEEEETPAPSTDEEVNKGQENQGSTDENDGNGTTENGTTENGTTENGSGSTSTEENENKDTTVEGGNQGSEGNSGNTTENTAPSTDNKEENKGQENQGGNEGNKETIVEIENQGSKDNSGDTTENKAPSVANKGENKAQENQGGNEGNTGNSASEKGEEQQVSISSHRIDRVMAFVPQDSYDDDDEDAPKSPEEEFEMMGEDDEEEEEVDDETYNDDVDVYTSDVEGVDIPAEVYPVVLMKRKSRSLFRMVRARGNAKAAEASAGLMVMPVASLNPANTEMLSDFKVNLYKYNYDKNLFGNYEDQNINKIIGIENDTAGDETKTFYLNEPDNKKNLQNSYLPNAYGWEGYGQVAFQGIMASTYNESGKIQLSNDYNIGRLNEVSKLFPENGDTLTAGITSANYGVDIKDVLQKVDDYYVFNAVESKQGNSYKGQKLRMKLEGNALKKVEGRYYSFDGFFPYNKYVKLHSFSKNEAKKCTFGMKVSFDFNLSSDGKTAGKPMTFTFAGDDDVWVYIRKKNEPESASRLAMDLGGIHGLTKGSIDFSTGIIKHNDVFTGTKEAPSHGEVDWYLYNDKDASSTAQNGIKRCVGFERPKADFDEVYTLDFYYMERGGYSSNCYMEFNLPVIPSQGVRIQKNIQGGDATKAGSNFDFKVVIADDKNKLETYQDDSSNMDGVSIEPFTLKGGAVKDLNIDTGKYFYVEETNSRGTDKVKWKVSNSNGVNQSPVSGKKSDIYQVSNTVGYLLQCTNIYGELDPKVEKKAWKNYTEENEYDVTLEVEGDTIQTTTAGDSGTTVENIDVTNPVVTDILSNHVEPVGIKIGGSQINAPELYYGNVPVSGTSADGKQKVDNKGVRLNPEKVDDNTVKYLEPETSKEIAIYTIGESKIEWKVADSLAKGQKKVLTYAVKVTGSYTADYPDTATNGRDTGTHSDETGYFSNKEAYLTYTDAMGKVNFPKPVVKVAPILTISKKVEVDGNMPDQTYNFTVEFKQGNTSVSIPTKPEGVTQNSGKYNFTLAKDHSIVFKNLPEGVSYTVTEITPTPKEDDDYVLTSVQAKVDGTLTEATKNNPIVSGTINKGESNVEFTNVYSKYGIITVEKTLAGDEQAYPDEKIFNFTLTPKNNPDQIYSEKVITINSQETTASAIFKINPEDIEKEFIITEVGTRNAWKTTVDVNSNDKGERTSETVKAGDNVKFTNYYYKRDLELKKVLTNASNPSPDAQYKFNVTVTTKDSIQLDETDFTLADNTSHSVENFSEQNGTCSFSVKLKAGETVKLVNIPKEVASINVVEDLTECPGMNPNYQAVFVLSKLNGDNAVEQNAVTIDYADNTSQSDTITITNKLVPAVGKLSITKKLVKNPNKGSENPAAKENVTFTFKVTNITTQESFYVSVPIAKDASEGSKEITVPVGNYALEEMPNLQYQADSNNPTEVTVRFNQPETVTFQNYRCADGYFTDSKITVNTVENGKFKSVSTSGTKSRIRQIAALFTNGGKTEDDDDNEN